MSIAPGFFPNKCTSAYLFRVKLRQLPPGIFPIKHSTQLLSAHLHRFPLILRPAKGPFLESFRTFPESITIPHQHLQNFPCLSAEYKQTLGKRIQLHLLLHQHGQ